MSIVIAAVDGGSATQQDPITKNKKKPQNLAIHRETTRCPDVTEQWLLIEDIKRYFSLYTKPFDIYASQSNRFRLNGNSAF